MSAPSEFTLWRAMVGEDEPTLRSVAEGLARVHRWLNRMSAPWSVLQHTLACHQLALEEGGPITQLAVLFHDAEEMITGDIPHPVKTRAQSELGDMVRTLIWDRVVNIPAPGEASLSIVRSVDHRLLLAEVHALGHPRLRQEIPGEPDERAQDLVWSMLDMDHREQVHIFTSLVEGLLRVPTVRALYGRK